MHMESHIHNLRPRLVSVFAMRFEISQSTNDVPISIKKNIPLDL